MFYLLIELKNHIFKRIGSLHIYTYNFIERVFPGGGILILPFSQKISISPFGAQATNVFIYYVLYRLSVGK